MSKNTQVIIVGGGPVGVALAIELGMRGVPCVLLERRERLQNIPKGQNLTQRTLEHFWFWGIADDLRAARVMPPGYPIGTLTAYGSFSTPYWHAPPGREQVREFYFQDNDRLPQYCTEAVLRKKLATLKTVDNRMGWAATAVTQDANGVRVTIKQEGGTATEELTAEYVVGCDGARSMVRDQIGIKQSGQDFEQLMLLTVFRSRELHDGLKRYPERSTYRVMNPELNGYWQFLGRIDVGEGWFFHSPVPNDSNRENFDAHAFLEKVAGFPFKAEFDHVGFWDMRIAVAGEYQVGRAFIAGDAAHSHPPYGGYGLNNGLEDARNLGWKLAARLQGWGGDSLLKSYGLERERVFRETADDFIGKEIEAEAKFMERYNPNKDKAEFEKAWANFDDSISTRVMSYEPNYEGSPVVVGPPNGVSGAHGEHMIKARAGHHLTPRKLSSGRNVYEELGPGFTLLAFGVDDAQVAPFETAAKAQQVPLKVVRDDYGPERKAYEAPMILVRPDQYVVWTGDKAPDAAALFKKVTGR